MTPTRIYRSSKSAQNRRPEPADMGGSVMSHELAGHAIRFGCRSMGSWGLAVALTLRGGQHCGQLAAGRG